MDKNLEQIYRVDYTGDGEHELTDVWCIIGKSEVPSPYILNSPFENGGGYGAVYIKSSDDKLKEDFVTARDLIENFSVKYEDVTTEKIFKIWNSNINEYWISTPYSKSLNPFVIVNEVFEGLPGYDVYVKAYSSSHAFYLGKQLLDKYVIETINGGKRVDRVCKTCDYYYGYSSEEYNVDRSECRYNPPTTFVYDKTFRNNSGNPEITRVTDAHWPKVSKSDWCGKYIEIESANNG